MITHLDPGGAQDNTLLSVAGMNRDRYEIDLVGGPGALEQRAGAAADHLLVLRYWRRSLLNLGDLRVLVALLRLVGGYDVVHTHGAKAGVLGPVAARLRGVPAVVHTWHSLPVHPYMSRVTRAVLLCLARLAAPCCDRIVFVCDPNAVEAQAMRIAKPRQLAVVVSGVRLEGLMRADGASIRQELAIPHSAPVVGTVTRLMDQKAPLDFAAMARTVLAARPDVHVVVVGDGPLRAEVEAATAGLSRLHLLGRRDDVPDLLAAMDVVAFSSLWEGLGRALTEAVLAGRPIVATEVNGVPDLVVDGETGYLVPPRAPDRLAARVLDVLAQPDQGAAMGALGAARIRGRFGVEDMLSGLDALYQEVLAEKRRGAA